MIVITTCHPLEERYGASRNDQTEHECEEQAWPGQSGQWIT
jgi:hypothetical protein